MTIDKKIDGKTVIITLQGDLDTSTSPMLDDELKTVFPIAENLIFDFKDLGYVSSAGLRVILFSLQTMSEKGGMVIRNVQDDVMEVFRITGFLDILNIE